MLGKCGEANGWPGVCDCPPHPLPPAFAEPPSPSHLRRSGYGGREWLRRLKALRRAGRSPHRGEGAGLSFHNTQILRRQKQVYKSALLSRRALVMTDTELNVMATLAMMGLSKSPKNG